MIFRVCLTTAALGFGPMLPIEAEARQLPGPPTSTAVGDRWAVVVGVDGYEDPAIPSNRQAVSDASTLHRWLTRTAGWPADHVALLVDGGNARHGDASDMGRRFAPNRENLDWAVRQWLAKRAKRGDLVLIYFAGHAVSLPDRAEDPPGSRPRDFLLPSDARAVDYDSTGWSLDAALDELAARGTNSIVCWLDTAALGRGRGVPLRASAAPSPRRLVASLTRRPGVTAWLAGGERPIPESPRLDTPSVFLSAVTEGMGTAERPLTLLACLEQARNDAALNAQGFTALGGVPPEWSLWKNTDGRPVSTNGDLVVQAGHADRVGSIAISADGTFMATGSMDGSVRLWTLRDRALLHAVVGFRQGVTALALSPDGRRIIAGDGFGSVRFWDRRTHDPSPRSGSSPHAGPVAFAGFLPDGSNAITFDLVEGRALLWNTRIPDVEPTAIPVERVTAAACAFKRGGVVAALADADGRVSLIGPEGAVVRRLDRAVSPVTALAFSKNSREIAVADEIGLVRFNAADGRAIGSAEPSRAGAGWLEYGADGALYHRKGRSLGRDGRVMDLVLPSEAGRIVISADAKHAAFADEAVGGSVHLFAIRPDDPVPFVEVLLPKPDAVRRETTAAAFAPDGARLVAGEASGGLRIWSIGDHSLGFEFAPNRRRVSALAASPDGKTLLQISAPDGQADFWHLDSGEVRSLPGRWRAGVFVDKATLALCGGDGGVATFRIGGTASPKILKASTPMFDKIAAAPDGTWIMAGSMAGRAPIVAFWETGTGKPRGVIRRDGLDLHSIAVSPDGRKVALTVDAKVYVFHVDPSWTLEQAAVLDLEGGEPGEESVALTASEWLRDGSGRLALGTGGGRVYVWDATRPKPVRLSGGASAAVRRILSSEDGKSLVAAGDERILRVWSVDGGMIQPGAMGLLPQHDDVVNALASLGATLVSGSDDGRTRFWSWRERRLLGTLGSVEHTGAKKPPGWVCFTPDGLFDSSSEGADHARWTLGESARSLEQLADHGYYVPRLTSTIARGETPEKPAGSMSEPPATTLELGRPRTVKDPEAIITIDVGGSDRLALRLYQDGAPIQSSEDLQSTAEPGRKSTTVRLHHGINRIWAMASKPGAIDGRSETLALEFDGPDSPPRLHVLALGISEYQRRALRYADDDARTMADLLYKRGLDLGGEPGVRSLLTDREVTSSNIEREFKRIRDVVRKRPQDTVVVFLAAHTDVLDKKFCLLLPNYPFGNEEPLLASSRGGDGRAAANPDAVLSYGLIYSQLSRLNALQRLVIVDACRAEAIRNDPLVELMKRRVAVESRSAKTSYLFAAREGEAASEVSDLKHGLLTYSVLRGLKADLDPIDVDPFAGAGLPPDADLDGDGVVETRELDQYVRKAVPVLASKYQFLVKRGESAKNPASTEPASLDGDDASFPIIPVKSATKR